MRAGLGGVPGAGEQPGRAVRGLACIQGGRFNMGRQRGVLCILVALVHRDILRVYDVYNVYKNIVSKPMERVLQQTERDWWAAGLTLE